MKKCKYGKIGERYGRLTIIGEAEPRIYPNGKRVRVVSCQCECGNIVDVVLSYLRNGDTSSCGCKRKEVAAKFLPEINKKYNTFYINPDTGIATGYTNKGEKFYLDKEDLPKVEKYCWYINNNGYPTARDGNDHVLMHRLIMNCPENMIIDHIDRCRVNNCKDNLRICTKEDNNKNRKIKSSNKSGVTGVCFDNKIGKWIAFISINKKQTYLGSFVKKQDAIKARLLAELEHYGTFSPIYEKLTQNEPNQQSQQNT